MNAEKIDIPNELRILNPEFQKKPVLVGKDAYMIYPLTEGQAERVSQLISDIIIDITTLDMKCPNCDHIFPNKLGRQETCNKCSNKKGKGGHQLVSMQKTPVEALTQEDRIPKLVEELVGIPEIEVKDNLTINQFKHLAGVLYEQNFKEEGEGAGLPDDSRKNFQALLDWVGLGAPQKPMKEKKEDTVALEKSTKPLPTSMGLQENMFKENGSKPEEEEIVGKEEQEKESS